MFLRIANFIRMKEMPADSDGDSPFELLPEPLVFLILSKIRSARPLVLCSAVCRRFRKLVNHVPSLTFNSDEIKGPILNLSRSTARNDSIIINCAMQMERLHGLCIEGSPTAPISAACIHACATYARASLQTLIVKAAVRNGVPEVTIQNLACCKSLTYLHLRWQARSDEVDPLGFFFSVPRFERLQSLVLEQMVLSDKFVMSLLAACPNLEVLCLDAISGLESPTLQGAFLTHVRVAKWACVSEILMGMLMQQITVLSPISDLEVRDTQQLSVPHSSKLRSLRVHAHSQVMLDIKDTSKLERFVVEGPPRVDVLIGNVRWDFRHMQAFLHGCSSLRELSLVRTWFHRGVQVPAGELPIMLDELIGSLPVLRKLSIGPRIVDSLWQGFLLQRSRQAATRDLLSLGDSSSSGGSLSALSGGGSRSGLSGGGEGVHAGWSPALRQALQYQHRQHSGDVVMGREGDADVASASGAQSKQQFPSVCQLSVQLDRLSLGVAQCLAALLDSFPSCRTVHVDGLPLLEPEFEGPNDPAFFSTVLDIQRARPEVDISVSFPRALIDFRAA
eukprot:TRINITY_DN16761_c0_g1_i1.p1 TRINITY_DN16761_c0_g1~~TRINITY_DN16761_c0_g1_i1.p1  ORF type:complete len:562 (+),score=66.12 TRINITY_DN16761_c0_g1_i1:572-2257(+)